MNIVMCLGGLRIGGAERQAITLAGELLRLGQNVTIVAFDDGPLRELVQREGIPVRVVGRVVGTTAVALPRLRDALRELQPDVVYAFLQVQWVLASAAVRAAFEPQARPKVVLGLRTGFYARPRGMRSRIVYELARHATSRADLLIANSAAGLQSIQAHCGEVTKGAVIPNGIDTNMLRPRPESAPEVRAEWAVPANAFVVGHVGRFHPVKDHRTLINAFAMFAKSQADAHLVCVGADPDDMRPSLLAHAQAHGLAQQVHFAGPRHDLARVYSTFNMLALTSTNEGFPNVVAEAMSCGVPAVVTDVGACREIVGQLGEVVPVGDASAIAAAMSRLAARLSPSLSALCRRRIVDGFTVQSCAVRTLDAFASLTSMSVQP